MNGSKDFRGIPRVCGSGGAVISFEIMKLSASITVIPIIAVENAHMMSKRSKHLFLKPKLVQLSFFQIISYAVGRKNIGPPPHQRGDPFRNAHPWKHDRCESSSRKHQN